QWGYQAADLSVVYPVARGTGPLLSTLGAMVVLAERPTGTGWLGLACVVLGILLIASHGNIKQFWSSHASRGVRWGAFIGVWIASYTMLDAYLVKEKGVQPVVLDWFTYVGSVMMLLPSMLPRRREFVEQMRGKWRYAIA